MFYTVLRDEFKLLATWVVAVVIGCLAAIDCPGATLMYTVTAQQGHEPGRPLVVTARCGSDTLCSIGAPWVVTRPTPVCLIPNSHTNYIWHIKSPLMCAIGAMVNPCGGQEEISTHLVSEVLSPEFFHVWRSREVWRLWRKPTEPEVINGYIPEQYNLKMLEMHLWRIYSAPMARHGANLALPPSINPVTSPNRLLQVRYFHNG